MENEFVTYDHAIALKELEFDEECLACFINGEIKYVIHTNNITQRFRYAAPLKQQLFRWLREKYGLHIGICHQANNKFDCWTNGGYLLENGKYCDFDTYEEAELACIDKLIELAKQQPK